MWHNSIAFVTFKREDEDFAQFEISYTSNGFRCENGREDYNNGLPVEHSVLLQKLLRTLVEETLDVHFAF